MRYTNVFNLIGSRRLGKSIWLIGPALLAAAAVGAQAETYERPGNRSASQILAPNQITGLHYRVRDEVVSYGYMHHYTVDSDFGTFEVTGDGALRKLLTEIPAIAALREIKKGDAFVNAVGSAAKAPIHFGKNLITHPVDTITGVPKGIFRIFGNVAESVTTKHDPSEDSRLEQALFVSTWKRDYCAKFKCDVYSSNKVLQKELNSVGWAAAIGGLTVSAALMPVGGAAVAVFKGARMADAVNESLNQEPPSRLRLINQKKFDEMGIPEALSKRYLDHPHFTPRHDTIIATALSHLSGARGRDVFLKAALIADDETGANFFMNIAQVLRGYHSTVSPIAEIREVGGFTVARTANGAALISFPLDHGVWSSRADRVLSAMKENYTDPKFNGRFELWVTGTVSPLARRQLAALGITVTENVYQRIEIMD